MEIQGETEIGEKKNEKKEEMENGKEERNEEAEDEETDKKEPGFEMNERGEKIKVQRDRKKE